MWFSLIAVYIFLSQGAEPLRTYYPGGVSMLENRRIVVGVTGGIAAYKAAELISRLKKAGAQVRVVMTENATKFIPPLTLETLSGNRAYVDQFNREFEIEHIALAKWAELFVVAPATANFIGKMANGIADDLMSTTAMAVTCPVLLAPAMNTNMWKNPACQANMKTLLDRGVMTVGPESGKLACGDTDVGRMSEPAAIAARIEAIMGREKDLAGRTVMVTAGPTVERIDPVRFITNRSTGKMGYAIAEAARDRGAHVILVSGPVNLPAVPGVEMVNVVSSAQLCENVLNNGSRADIIIQAAAPADYTPAHVADKKIKKQPGEGMTLELVPTTDIAAELGRRKHDGQVLVAFAAETNDVTDNARKKLVKKNADMIVANDVTRPGAGFGTDTNLITIITADTMDELPMMSKRDAADAIIDAAKKFLK